MKRQYTVPQNLRKSDFDIKINTDTTETRQNSQKRVFAKMFKKIRDIVTQKAK